MAGRPTQFKGTPEEWLDWLVGGDEQRAHDACLALGGIGPDDGIAPDPFVAALSSANENVVFWATIALARLGPKAARATPTLVEISSQHPAFGVRQAAVSALSQIIPSDPLVKVALLAALQDPHAAVRREALQALTRVRALEDDDLHLIAKLSGDADKDVARWSEIVLRSLARDRKGER